tara:strand:- start:387 stop:923 length:537 start_codon:yes stop_codon:yes gene_type:complete
MSNKTMLCNGRYVTNDPCYPLCSLPDGSGCDYGSIFGGGGIGGPTSNYSVTTGNAVAGNTSTRTFVTPIDPYQNITPSMLNANGGGNSRDLWFNQSGGQRNNQSRDLWFNQSGDAVIEVDGNKYSYEPVLTWDRGCDNLDNSGDGIFPGRNCKNRSKFGGVDGLRLGAYRFKNGVMDN